MGMPTRNTMVVPCMVKSRLKVSGGTMCRPGHASCSRIMLASMPAMTKKSRPTVTYMIPRRLWSTVTTQSWSWSRTVRGTVLASGPIISLESTLMSVTSLESDQIRGERLQLLARDFHGGHERASLQGGGIFHPRVQVLARVTGCPRPDGPAGHEVRQVGPEHPVGRRAAHGVAVDARQRGEELPPALRRRVVPRGSPLGGDPALELVLRVHHHHEEHEAVLDAAVLRALADVGAGTRWLDPHVVGLVGDHVHLARELGHPEAVDDVYGLESDEGGCGLSGVAHRHVELIGGDHAELGIANLPPPLVADDGHFHRARRLRTPLDPPDVAGSDEEEHDDDEERHDRPRQLDPVTAVDLGRLAGTVGGPPAIAHDGIHGEARHDDEDDGGDGEHEEGHLANEHGGGGNRRKDIGGRAPSVGGCRQRGHGDDECAGQRDPAKHAATIAPPRRAVNAGLAHLLQRDPGGCYKETLAVVVAPRNDGAPGGGPGMDPESKSSEPHVLILGAGFGGVAALKALRDTRARVTLLDRNSYQTFQPLLYQVATDELSIDEVGFPLHNLLRGRPRWAFHRATVTGIDLEKRQVAVDDMTPFSYDYLVVGLGAVVNFFGVKGAAEHAFPLYTLRDATKLKAHVLQSFEAADRNPSLADDGALTVCVVGGGATGVEVAGALAELVRYELQDDYPNLPMDNARVVLYEMGPEL